MYDRELVPSDFVVPLQLDCGSYALRMLSVDDLELDYEAVIASKDRLNGLFGSSNSWPEGLTVKDDLIDLAWHQREFTLRHSFAYTVMSTSVKLCLGCVYIFPSSAEGYDAAAFYWVRSGATAESRDAELGKRLRTWLADAWPFRHVAFPGRDIAWSDWRAHLSNNLPHPPAPPLLFNSAVR